MKINSTRKLYINYVAGDEHTRFTIPAGQSIVSKHIADHWMFKAEVAEGNITIIPESAKKSADEPAKKPADEPAEEPLWKHKDNKEKSKGGK